MSCIVGVESAGLVTIGGDAAAVSDHELTVRFDQKVFEVGEYLIGFEDSFRMGQILRYRLSVPRQKCEDDFEHLATVFIDAVRKAFSAGGFTTSEDGADVGGRFLVGYRGALYSVDTDFHVGRSLRGYEAIGAGGPYALGSLASTLDLEPEQRVRQALVASATHCVAVSAPFAIFTINESENP